MIKTIFNFFGSKDKTLDLWLIEFHFILNNKGLKKHTLDNKNSLIKILKSRIGHKKIRKISTLDLAEIINEYVKRGTNSAAKAMYQIIKEIFREAYFNGWITTDPTTPLRPPKTPPKRSRLTFDEFKKILNSAKKSRQQYFYQAMIVALVTGQRRSDIVAIQRSDIKNGFLFIEQYKTGAKIALPLNLYCEKLDMTLEHVINKICTGKKYLIENNKKQVKLFSLTQYFSEFRDKIYYDRKYWNGTPPSFHEIRSLSERLYRAQGVDTMNLLGHKSQQMTDKYNDSRGREWRYLRI
jgi:enterobacteria phage integrase